MKFQSNTKFHENFHRYSLKKTSLITMKFGTYQDSTTVFICAKFYCDWTDMKKKKLIQVKFQIWSKSVSGACAKPSITNAEWQVSLKSIIHQLKMARWNWINSLIPGETYLLFSNITFIRIFTHRQQEHCHWKCLSIAFRGPNVYPISQDFYL